MQLYTVRVQLRNPNREERFMAKKVATHNETVQIQVWNDTIYIYPLVDLVELQSIPVREES